MQKQNYMARMDATLSQLNRKALRYGDGQAWDKRKAKCMCVQAPRGKVYRRLLDISWKELHRKNKEIIEIATEYIDK